MKSLFSLFKSSAETPHKSGAGKNAPPEPSAFDLSRLERTRINNEDSDFFSSRFQELDEDQAIATWPKRLAKLHSKPLDEAFGRNALIQIFTAQRYAHALPADQLEVICHYLQFVEILAGQDLIAQDEYGDYMLIVLEGRVGIERRQTWGGNTRLVEAKPGDILGEMSLLDAGMRFSGCHTLVDCKIAVLEASHLDQMMEKNPHLAAILLAWLARRISLNLRQVSLRLSNLLAKQ